MYRYIILVLLSCVLFGCMPSPFYQREEVVPQNAWGYTFTPSFKFDVTDTTANYSTYFVVRHTDAYPYSNIWVWVYYKQPNDTSFQKQRINIQLAEASGKWLGRGMGEIYEQYMPFSITDSTHKLFRRSGTYEIKFEQNMRVNPLPEILHVGLRVEKTHK